MQFQENNNQQHRRPYCAVGAGRLTSFIWKSGDSVGGWRYRFNLFRSSPKGSRVTQLYRVSDLLNLVKLVQVLATVILDDGCVSANQRQRLRRLVEQLSDVTSSENQDDHDVEANDDEASGR